MQLTVLQHLQSHPGSVTERSAIDLYRMTVLSHTETLLVVEEIRNLIQKGAILEVPFIPSVGFYSNLFLLAKKGGASQRPVINLANFNKFVGHAHTVLGAPVP